MWFSLLRLLDGTLDQVPHFPAGDLFVKVWMLLVWNGYYLNFAGGTPFIALLIISHAAYPDSLPSSYPRSLAFLLSPLPAS